MSEEIASVPGAPGVAGRKKTLLALVGGAAVACVIVATATGVARYRADTASLCDQAVASVAASSERSAEVLAAADASLAAATDDAVKAAVSGAGNYSKRPVGAQGGSSSGELVMAAEQARSAVADAPLVARCDSRTEAEELTDETEAHEAAVLALVDAVDRLDADVREFSEGERARIAAERAVAERAAAEAAAQAEAAAADIGSWIPQPDPGWAADEASGQWPDPAPDGEAGGGADGGAVGGGRWDSSGILPDPCEATNSCVRPNL